MSVVAVGLLVLVFLFGGRIVSLYVEYLWFGSLGYVPVFTTALVARFVLFALGAVLFLVLFLPNVLLARAVSRRIVRRLSARLVDAPGSGREPFIIGGMGKGSPSGGDRPRPFGDLMETMGGAEAARLLVARLGSGLLLVAGATLAFFMALAASGQWETMLRARHAVPFGTADPVFQQDIGFYVFILPAIGFWHGWILWTLILTGGASAALYGLALYAVDPTFLAVPYHLQRGARAVRSHLLALGAVTLGLIALGIWLSTFDILVARHGRIIGANYTDLHARLPATQALAASVAVTALRVLVTIWRRSYSLPLAGIVLAAVALVVGRGALPILVQRIQVEPAEVSQERPYIVSNIRYTREGFGLSEVSEQIFPAEPAVRLEEVRQNPTSVVNIRLWDHRPLKDVYNQLQSIRNYYVFGDVDVDRYIVDGQYRQVMLSARELVPERLGAQAQTWVNRRLQYTHGYGLAMSPVNQIVGNGAPSYFLENLPPVGRLPIRRPEIYYGEATTDYVIVNTEVQEFDYPSGDQNVFSTYSGSGGVALGPWWRRVALAAYFGDFNLLISNYLRPDSRVLFQRRIADRVRRLAPHLKLDRDPYLVTAEGQLYWILDAYTTTDRYPYAQITQELVSSNTIEPAPVSGTAASPAVPTTAVGRRIAYNYIRNSAKVVVNAFDGSVTAYVSEPADPIIQTYAAIFPQLYRPLSDMPAALRAHVRYPEDLFRVQAQILRSYHVQDPQVFYNSEDIWGTALEMVGGDRVPVDPYYVIMRLPGETAGRLEEEFLLMLPFTPAGRDNMIAWLAARSDGDQYGKLVLYRFPKDRQIFGPAQIEALIDQETTISSQLTLWNQQGSRVVRGNLLVIPIGASTLYVEPIYLQSEGSRLPELKRVIVATGNRLVMEPTLEEGLARLFGADVGLPGPATTASGTAGSVAPVTSATGAVPQVPQVPGAPPVGTSDAAREARAAYQRALEALRGGDFGRFGDELRALDERLRELEQATASPAP
ncbi:MAG: UPF0182 family protein [Chloroflexota bacterium]|nr:UPF0182 family protein [Chloroflexota bacterium]